MKWFRRLRCSWTGHPLTVHVMEFVKRLEPPTAYKLGPWVPVSSELLADAPSFSLDYSLRCKCGKETDPTIRNMFDGAFGGAA